MPTTMRRSKRKYNKLYSVGAAGAGVLVKIAPTAYKEMPCGWTQVGAAGNISNEFEQQVSKYLQGTCPVPKNDFTLEIVMVSAMLAAIPIMYGIEYIYQRHRYIKEIKQKLHEKYPNVEPRIIDKAAHEKYKLTMHLIKLKEKKEKLLEKKRVMIEKRIPSP